MGQAEVQAFETSLIRDEERAVELAQRLTPEELFPLLTKYAKPVHPFGTRERVLGCLSQSEDERAVVLLVTFLTPLATNDELRAQAAAVLADRNCGPVADELFDIIGRDVHRLLQLAPTLIGLSRAGGSRCRATLEGLRADLATLNAMTDAALEELEVIA